MISLNYIAISAFDYRDMRIEGDKLESLAKDIKVVLRVDYALKTGEVPGVYNAALLRVSPAIPLE